MVSLGDWFDSWTGDVKEAQATAQFLKNQTKDWTLVIGNHDVSYGWGPGCSGWTLAKHKAINSILSPEDWGRFVPSTKVGPYLCTHAGVHRVFWDTFRDVQLGEVGKYLKGPLWGAGWDRGGDQAHGGIVWCDWRNLDPPNTIKQICGHTPAVEVRYKHGKDVVCLDTSLRHYAIWDGKTLEIR